jgi:hypothetical protein
VVRPVPEIPSSHSGAGEHVDHSALTGTICISFGG